MVIRRQPEPPGARNILHAALITRMRSARHILALRGSPRTGAPLPIYRLSYSATASPEPLRKARKVGLYYPIVGGDTPGLGHLIIARGGLRFAGVSEGRLALGLLDAATLAEDKLRTKTRIFTARLLEIPSLRIYALWLHSRDKMDCFVFLTGEERHAKSQFSLVGDIAPQIKRALTTTAHRSDRHTRENK